MNIDLTPRTILRNLSLFVIFLLFANITGLFAKQYFGNDYVYSLIRLFDFDAEHKIPTLYSSFALIVCSLLLCLIAIKHKQVGSSYIYWMGLAVLFVFLSVDETASIHEGLTVPVRESLNTSTSGPFHSAWVIPYGIAPIVFAALYFRFLMRLPKRIKFLLIVSGVIFVSGAIGFEMLGGWQVELYGRSTLYYLTSTCEELLEMCGVVVFIYTLLSYITNEFNFLTVTIKSNT